MSNAEEKKVVHDLKVLKQSLPYAESLLKIQSQIDTLYSKKKPLQTERGDLNAVIEVL